MNAEAKLQIQRVQTGVRLEKGMLAAMRELAENSNRNLGELLEELVWHAFEGNGACAWYRESLPKVEAVLKKHGADYGPHACYSFHEMDGPVPGPVKDPPMKVEREQAGFKMEKGTLNVLKAIAIKNDARLGHVIEEIIAHQVRGAEAFSKKALENIKLLQKFYGIEGDGHTYQRFVENE